MSDGKLCEIIQDLIPLYRDGALSPGSAEFVRSHLETCGECRQACSEEREEEQSVFLAESEREENVRYRKIARKLKWRRGGILLGLAGLVILLFILSAGMFQRAVVSGSCMEPAVSDGETYMLNRWSYTLSGPRRNDIIVYELDGICYMTRVVGLPGESVEMKDGVVAVDGSVLTEQREYPENCSFPLIRLGEDEYWTVTDHLEGQDKGSRIIKKKDIVGKVWITH